VAAFTTSWNPSPCSHTLHEHQRSGRVRRAGKQEDHRDTAADQQECGCGLILYSTVIVEKEEKHEKKTKTSHGRVRQSSGQLSRQNNTPALESKFINDENCWRNQGHRKY